MAMTNSIAALAAKLTSTRTVERKVRRKVGEDSAGIIVHESKKNVDLKPTIDPTEVVAQQAAASAAFIRVLHTADIPHYLQDVGADATAALLLQAQNLAAVEDQFGAKTAADLRILIDDAIVKIKAGYAADVKGLSAALGAAGSHGKVLAMAYNLNVDRLAAAMPGAAARVQAAEAKLSVRLGWPSSTRPRKPTCRR